MRRAASALRGPAARFEERSCRVGGALVQSCSGNRESNSLDLVVQDIRQIERPVEEERLRRRQ
jgi:hypothetical protein